ncbi:HAMP domain-containing sensor histidine kinase [Paenibacillus dendritiformis]|uniref:sensor histidine kinase n=1 Tax=Paenibacillus dendritiformis TaxID=130049 RepID=UPI00248C1E97|nr:HAMP domain-containing sensor histidine kinase [Paenibacillus dendritiformis]WGU97133.1 HAMP domain-containing sensor histidine kinase [Paenibacillus dendritiformis]
MKSSRRLAWHYAWQWLLIGAMLLGCICAAFLWVAERMSALDMSRNLPTSQLSRIVESVQVDRQGRVVWPDEVFQRLRSSGGWLQVLNEDGKVVDSFNAPGDMPTQYAPGEAVAYVQRELPSKYGIFIYIRSVSGRNITLLYGTYPPQLQLLDKWLASREKGIPAAESIRRLLAPHDAWVTRLDAAGRTLESWNKPAGVAERLTLQEIALRSLQPEHYAHLLAYRYNPATGDTWVLQMPHQTEGAGVTAAGLRIASYQDIFFLAVGGVIATMIIVFLLMAWWQSTRLARPQLHVMRWTERIAEGIYEEPADHRGLPRSERRSGKLRRNYRIYEDVMQALRQLASRLRSAEEERRQHERQREEWLAGLSHDLKTPLASIVGYARMLEAKQYDWSREEVAEFAGVMTEKAEWMDQLLQDLNLTYRLQSGTLPLQRERLCLDAWLEETLDDILDLPQHPKALLHYRRPDIPVWFSFDPRYFRRIIENICMNAFLHNPPGTALTISFSARDDEDVLEFRDDGAGMDAETLSHLFTRYYRGLSTDRAAEGSGLGMAISRQLAEAHGCTLKASSEPGGGTVILLSLPGAEHRKI